MIHARTLAEIEAFRQAANTAVLDPIVRDAARRWVRAWDILSAELEATALDLAGASPSALRRAARLTRTLERIADELAAVVKATADDTVAALPRGLQLAGDANAAMIRSQLPVGHGVGEIVAGWDRVDTDAIAAILARAEQQIYASSAPLSASATASMRENLIRGLASGDNPNDVARRMVRDTEGVFNGGLARAARIARTEMLDAMRAGGDAHDQANADILTGWTWIATLSARTCPSCWAQHGRDYPLSEPGPLDHQQGRCTRAPKTKTWRELGLDIDEPEQPASLDAEARFRELDAATQRDILGPKRYLAWSEGRYPMDRWSQRTSTDGWRDSWRVSPIGGGDALPPRPPTVVRPGSEADDATSWVELNRRFRTGAATFGDIANTEDRDARFVPTDEALVLYRVLTGDVRVRSNLVAAARVKGPWIDRAYQATSTTKAGALRHTTGDSDVLLEIHVPAGAPVMRSGSDVFLPRGSTLMLSNADVEDTGEGKMDTVRADLVASAALRGLST